VVPRVAKQKLKLRQRTQDRKGQKGEDNPADGTTNLGREHPAKNLSRGEKKKEAMTESLSAEKRAGEKEGPPFQRQYGHLDGKKNPKDEEESGDLKTKGGGET